MTRVTYVTPFVPYPQIPHAGGQFLYHYLSQLAPRIDVHLVAPATANNREAVDMAPAGTEVHLFPVPQPPRFLPGKFANYIRTRADGLSMGLGERQALAADNQAAAIVAGSEIVELHWSEALPLLPTVRSWAPSTLVVAYEHDVRSQALDGRARHASRIAERLLSRFALRRVREREPELLNRCAAVLVHSEKDAELLRQLGVRSRLVTAGPYLETPADPPGPAHQTNVVFVGAFDRLENVEGAMWFVDRVWPGLRSAIPRAKLILAGADPQGRITGMSAPDVEVTGYVEDLDSVYRSARVVACPLLSGAGIKFKVVQAMLYGLPVVATTVAADGIVDRSGPSAFAAVTDDPDAFAGALVQCLLDRNLAVTTGRRARDWAEAEYRFDVVIDKVLALYDDLVDHQRR